jgi:hypothetical protein
VSLNGVGAPRGVSLGDVTEIRLTLVLDNDVEITVVLTAEEVVKKLRPVR